MEIRDVRPPSDRVRATTRQPTDDGDGTPLLEPETCYRLRNARVGTHDGDTQIQIDETTSVEEVSRGTGWLPPVDDDENERLVEDPQLVVVEELRDEDGIEEDELVNRVTNRGVDDEHATTAVEQLLEYGVVVDNQGLRLA